MNRFFGFFMLCMILAGCAGGNRQKDWFAEYGTLPATNPSMMMYGTPPENASDNPDVATVHRMAVLLPLTGDAAAVGDEIRAAISAAVLEKAPQNLSIAFYDTAQNAPAAINTALATKPEIIIGPLFSNDAQILRTVKPHDLPVLSFTSDAAAVGDGLMTMALMPNNSIEAIVKEMSTDGVGRFVILAPNTDAGRLMAGVATRAADTYHIPVAGLFYYNAGDTDSIKNATYRASMNEARTAANTRAREILSDVVTDERLTAIEKSSLTMQLEKMSKSDTLGNAPYDAVLFLGGGDDTKSLASFLRYYGVGARDARFYGTALWDGADITRDFTLSGAKYAALPETSPEFVSMFEGLTGNAPSRLASFGYDAANLAMGMIYSNKSNAAYLLDPSGYVGLDGLIRLRPSGASERALQIVRLNGTGAVRTVRAPATNFIIPIYGIDSRNVTPAAEMDFESTDIEPLDFIDLPERFRAKYRTGSSNAAMNDTDISMADIPVITVVADDDGAVIENPEFQPVRLESVNRTIIDSVVVTE